MNLHDATRRLYAERYACHHDKHISWRSIRLRTVYRFGEWHMNVEIGTRRGTTYICGSENKTPKQAFLRFMESMVSDIRQQRADKAALPAFNARREEAAKTHSARILRPEERLWCKAHGWTRGYDTDDERFCPEQHSHLMTPEKSLCESPYVWFGGLEFDSPRGNGSFREEDNRISCPICLKEFELHFGRRDASKNT